MKCLLERFKSPVLWVSVAALIYSTVLVPAFPELPEWSAIAGYFVTIFGILNNPTDCKKF